MKHLEQDLKHQEKHITEMNITIVERSCDSGCTVERMLDEM